MISRYIFVILLAMFLYSCQSSSEAEKIINRSIEAHGGETYQVSTISFDFRDRHYEIFKSPDRFKFVREFSDSIGRVKDVLDNEGFTRTVNGDEVELEPKMRNAYANSVNAVAYFAFLPYGLNDEAVNKEYLGETQMEGKPYHKVKVTFSEDGGGEDHEDEFIYWINKNTFKMDYLAYSYHTDGGGVRFRKAINAHEVSGLVLQDYDNYKIADKDTPVEEMEALYKEGELELLSKILLENIEVEPKE